MSKNLEDVLVLDRVAYNNNSTAKNDAIRPWENLANAIILQAIEDHNEAVAFLKLAPKDPDARSMIRSIDNFLKSEWFTVLTKLDPDVIRQALKPVPKLAK